MKRQRKFITQAAIALALMVSAAAGRAGTSPAPEGSPQHPISPKAVERLQHEVRKELVMLPFYGVFDNFTYSVDGYTVTLMGQVTRPTLKSDAEAAVKRIEGVGKVVNNIEVLPVSPSDDRIRLATYRAIYSEGALERYAMQAVPPIHIIVKNGRITLEGVVNTPADKTLADLRAKGVPGVFSVTNNLRTEK